MKSSRKCEVRGCQEHTKSKYGTCRKHNEASLFRRYRALKKFKRHYKLSITYKQYCDLLVFNDFTCYYCGSDISGSSGYCLDRMDNNKGYKMENVVVCCGMCNKIKGNTFSCKMFKKIVDKLKRSFKINKKPKLNKNFWEHQLKEKD